MNNFISLNDNAPQDAQNGNMNQYPSLWIVRSKDDTVLSAYEGYTFRELYDFCYSEWPALLETDSISAMRIR